jgi:4-hydroxy-3-methylbut-2-enyl diphosphate reductase IspH
MGIVQVEELRLRQKEIEVRALVALAAHGVSPQRFRALSKLEKFAYPEDLADKINQQVAQKQLELL